MSASGCCPLAAAIRGPVTPASTAQPYIPAIGQEMTAFGQPQRSELTIPDSVDQRADLLVQLHAGQREGLAIGQ